MLHSLVLLLAWSPGGPLLRHSRSVSDVVGARLMEDDADHAQLLLQVAAQAAKASLEKGSSPEDAKAAGAAAWEAARRWEGGVRGRTHPKYSASDSMGPPRIRERERRAREDAALALALRCRPWSHR